MEKRDEPADPDIEKSVEAAMEDVRLNTLSTLEGRFRRLVYLASLRDYNTGRYHHYGLETRHTAESVDHALRRWHAQVFEDLIQLPLQDQTSDLIGFFESLREDRRRLIDAWKQLRSYRMLPPLGCNSMARRLFESNVEAMLTVLRETDLWELLHEPHSDADDLP